MNTSGPVETKGRKMEGLVMQITLRMNIFGKPLLSPGTLWLLSVIS